MAEEVERSGSAMQQGDAHEEVAGSAEIEIEARKIGWLPESEWVGAPPRYGFVGARVFLERGQMMVPILNAKLRCMRVELESLRQSSSEASRFMADANARALQARDELITELERAREKVAESGDGEASICADNNICDLVSGAGLSPSLEVQQFLAENEWYSTDPGLRAFADGYADILTADGMLGKPMLDQVAQRTREVFAHMFEEDSAHSVETKCWQQIVLSKKSYADLPDYAKLECDAFAAEGLMTRAEYVRNYAWDEKFEN